MKKLFITIIAILLPMLAMGQTLLYEKDFTGITEFTGWYQFDDVQTDGKVEVDPDGVAITVGIQTGQLWQPQTMVVPDGSFDLVVGGKYKVVITAKFPSNGTLQIRLGNWVNFNDAQLSITATGDYQEIVFNFDNYSVDAESAHLLFQCGDFKGTTIVKKVVVYGNGPDLCYNYINSGKVAEVIQNPNGYKGNIIIPEKVTHEGVEYTVKKIGDGAFSYCSGLTSITIPNSVTSIGSDAFLYCSGLTSITIPNSVTSIGNYAFNGCSGLTSVTIPNSVTSIRDWTFSYCSGLTSITIPNSVTSIGSDAFYGCSGLTSITIPNSVTSIGYGAFYDCSGLTSITISNSVTSIRDWTFYGCSGLTSVIIGSGVRNIYDNAFANCTKLEDVYCLAEVLYSDENGEGLSTSNNAFDGSYIDYATLHVPASAINAYKTTAPWSGFGTFETLSGDAPLIPKCATPTISYVNGEITFSCETEGVEYVSELSSSDVGNKYTDKVNITGKITVKVYATKSGYDKSDTAIAEIEVPGELKGDLNNDGTVNVADHVELTKIIMNEY